ncbi:hypothetical protein F4802DRAFT_608240 [Xylaria palmicola]|nr:hypothetical protein F4802DRAFT_608240 [Xylaria palmicola]
MASDAGGGAGQMAGLSSQAIARFAKQLRSHRVPTTVAPEPRLPNLSGAVLRGNQSPSTSRWASGSSAGPPALGRVPVPSSPATSTQHTQSLGPNDFRAFPKILQKIKTDGIEKFHQSQPLEVFKELPVPDDARRRFEELQNLFKSGLAAHMKLESFQYAVMWEVYMVGKLEADAKPMSVFYSDKKLAKRINGFFKQSHIQETMKSSNTNFPLHFVKKPPRLLNNRTDTRPIQAVPLDGILSFWTPPLESEFFATACGLPIAATLGGSSTWATIGGIVLVDGTVFGMTAGHLVSQLLPARDEASHNDTSSDVHSPRGDSPMSDSDTSEPESNSPRSPVRTPFDLATAQKIASRDLSESEYCEDIVNLDYTLVLLPPDLRLPNRMDKSKITFGKGKASKELLDIVEVCPEARFDRREVILMSANGYKPAVLKLRSASILVSPSTNFVNTLTLSLLQGFVLENGDSGSWVVESTQGSSFQVHGHLIAGLPNGDGMVVPIHTSLERMKEQTGAGTVKLPTAKDIRNLSTRTTYDPPVIPIVQSTAKTTSRDGISSINTWVTSISSHSKESKIAGPALPPLLEMPAGNAELPVAPASKKEPVNDTAIAAGDAKGTAGEEMPETEIMRYSSLMNSDDYSENAGVYNGHVSRSLDSGTLKGLRRDRIADFLNSRHDGPQILLGDPKSRADRRSDLEAFMETYHAIEREISRFPQSS